MKAIPELERILDEELVWAKPGSAANRAQRRQVDRVAAKIRAAVDPVIAEARAEAARDALLAAANDPAMNGDWAHFGQWLARNAARIAREVQP